MSAAQREAEVAKQKALLEWDINERNRTLDAEQKRAEREAASQLRREERGLISAGDWSTAISAQINSLLKDKSAILDNFDLTPEQKAERLKVVDEEINFLRMQSLSLAKRSGFSTGNLVTEDQLRQMVPGN
jgi:hypothetical protein